MPILGLSLLSDYFHNRGFRTTQHVDSLLHSVGRVGGMRSMPDLSRLSVLESSSICSYTYIQSIDQSINQSINQLIDQSIVPLNQSINQSVKQSIDQSINRSIDQSIYQSICYTNQKSPQSGSPQIAKICQNLPRVCQDLPGIKQESTGQRLHPRTFLTYTGPVMPAKSQTARPQNGGAAVTGLWPPSMNPPPPPGHGVPDSNFKFLTGFAKSQNSKS